MFIAITGLHASGKSYFIHNIPEVYGFEVYDKKDIVKKLCRKETERNDYWEWYKEEYNKNPYDTTYKILSELPFDKNIILDAVHSYKEWKIIKSINKEAIIVLVTTPEMIRATRWEEGDKEKDKIRIEYWHSDYEGESGCLLTEVSWSFNGAASLETNIASFEELIHCYGLNNNRNKQKILTRK